MFFSSVTAARHAHDPSSIPQEPATQSIDKAKAAIGRGDVQSAVGGLLADLGGNQHALHDAILNLLGSSSSGIRQDLIAQARSRHPHFDLHARGKEGKTALDLAVRHDDLGLAHYLLNQGANPERTDTAVSAGMRALLTSWRRQTLLYAHHNEQDRQGWTDLDRALQAGRHDEARALLKEEMAGGSAQQAWKTAMAGGRRDILRALLVVGTPEELRALTRQQFAMGKWLAELREDAGLSAVLKEFPYQSAKRGWPKFFNGQATFDNTMEKILCRYLSAYQQEQQARDPHIKFDYGKFRSPREIANNVTADIKKTCKALKAQASETHLIDNTRFGQFLADQFAAMENKHQPTRLMLVESTNHMMNLGLRIKHQDGKPFYVVKFFDPNVTTTGTRSKAGSVQAFEMQTIASYLAEEEWAGLYYPEARGWSMIYVRPEGDAQAGTAISCGSSAGRTLNTCIEAKDIDATVVWHLMDGGFTENLRQLQSHLNTLPEDRRIELLAAKDGKGFPALYMSMQEGHTEAVKVYGELLASIPEERRVELLAAKDDSGFPALCMGMWMEHVEAVKTYGELLALIPEDQRVALIAAKDPLGHPALYMAMEHGHVAAIKAYAALLASIPEDRRIALIEGKNGKGFSALYAGMYQGNAEAVKAYGELLKLVPPDRQAELLLAKPKRMNGLNKALELGKFGAVKECLDILIRLAPDLSPKRRASLRKELQGYEKSILKSKSTVNSLSQYREMASTFSRLKKALAEDASGSSRGNA